MSDVDSDDLTGSDGDSEVRGSIVFKNQVFDVFVFRRRRKRRRRRRKKMTMRRSMLQKSLGVDSS